MTGVLSGSGYASYAVGAAIGGLAVAHIGYSALSYALIASTLGSSLLLTLLIHTRARRPGAGIFSSAVMSPTGQPQGVAPTVLIQAYRAIHRTSILHRSGASEGGCRVLIGGVEAEGTRRFCVVAIGPASL